MRKFHFITVLKDNTIRVLTEVAIKHGYKMEIAHEDPNSIEIIMIETVSHDIAHRIPICRVDGGRWVNAMWDIHQQKWKSIDVLNHRNDDHYKPLTCIILSSDLNDLTVTCNSYHTPDQAFLSVIYANLLNSHLLKN